MGIYELDTILKTQEVDKYAFMKWKDHPRFIEYLRQETDAWNAAANVGERTKLKAGIIMEEFMTGAFTELHDKKTPLNQRVELAKLLAKLAGMGEPRVAAGGAGGGGFNLQINIAPGVAPVVVQQQVPTIEHEDTWPSDEDGYDPFTSPTTLDE